MRRIRANCDFGPARRGRRIVRAAAVLLALLTLAGCSGETDVKSEKQLFSMDTVMLLTCYGKSADKALDAAADAITALDSDLDPESQSSSVYALNAGAGDWVSVSPACLDVMSTAQTIFERTGGALDVGIYPLVKAWGFIDQNYRVPDQSEIDGLLANMDTADIGLDEAGQRICLPAGMEVSFGAVAKGYAGMQAIAAMRDAGAQYAIVSLGGNVQTLGDTKPDGSPWEVAITDPNDTGSYVGVLSVGETAVITSGGYQRYFVSNGVTYIHILDPSTGYPVDNGLKSVTVVCTDGAMADALSTALFVLGEQGALDYYKTYGGFGLVLITSDNRVVVTANLAEQFAENGENYTYQYLNY